VFGQFFDERFTSAAIGSYRYTSVRLLFGASLGVILGLGVSWTVAVLWMAAIGAAEAGLFVTTRPFAKGRPVTRAGEIRFAIANGVAVPAWTALGAILWASPSPACQIAAAGFMAGHLLYIQAHNCHSPGALLPSLPAVIAPAVIPLLVPHFSGADQVVVTVIMLAVFGNATVSIYVSLTRSKALLDAQRATEAASQAKSEFLARMSHEIRNPLNGVLGMTQALAAAPDLSARHRESLTVIRQSGEALLAIINDVLDLSKVEAGRMDLEQVEFDLADVVKGAQASFAAQAATKGLAFRLEFEPAAAGVYRGDPTRLRQILYNLLGNALKFTDAGEICLEIARRDSQLRLSVVDTGIGIAPENLGRIFGSYQQAETSTTRRFGGTGLGLSICHELITLMNGEIEVESRLGEGSRFSVLLPLQKLAAGVAPAGVTGDAEAEPDRVLKVLAAEDNAVNQLVLRTLLAQAGVTPTLVDNGEQAVEAWRAGDFDLILMDVQMPVMDGITATQAIRAGEAATGRTRTPILALTANAMAHQVAEYMAAGADGHVAKPIDARQLFDAIDGAMRPASAAKASAA
jgi:signal transduction histidine kinase/CheY-like chemotaxis protein